MRIATWNIERLKHKSQLAVILEFCEQARADILVLTETDTRVKPSFQHCFQTSMLSDDPVPYHTTERRVSIFTNYECVNRYPTYDERTALCVELATEHGKLLVYGTIFGIQGNRHPSFRKDLEKQLSDIRRFAAANHHLCVCGDFNCTFADNYYYTKLTRGAMENAFTESKLALLTESQAECIDHIALSRGFMTDAVTTVEEWNLDKKLSDHKGIVVDVN